MPQLYDTVTFEAPAFTSPAQVQSCPYRREPYARASVPGLGTVDAKVRRFSPTHLLLLWIPHPGGPTMSYWMPRRWVQPITREESTWKHADDLH